MDTIRRTASGVDCGIEEQLQELQREQGSITGTDKGKYSPHTEYDLSEFSLLDVYGMDRPELMQALSEMTDDDKLSIRAYLGKQGCMDNGNRQSGFQRVRKYHLDVRYNTDTDVS